MATVASPHLGQRRSQRKVWTGGGSLPATPIGIMHSQAVDREGSVKFPLGDMHSFANHVTDRTALRLRSPRPEGRASSWLIASLKIFRLDRYAIVPISYATRMSRGAARSLNHWPATHRSAFERACRSIPPSVQSRRLRCLARFRRWFVAQSQ